MFKTIAFLVVCFTMASARRLRDERDLLGSTIGNLGNVFWTKDMQVTGCRNHAYCNTQRCLDGIRGGNGIWGTLGNMVAGATAIAAKDILSDETHKSSCIAAGMYDENLERIYPDEEPY